MKKNLLLLAVAVAALASCSNDETIAVNNGNSNEISFRTLTTGVTRANAAGVRDGFVETDYFNVYAKHGSSKYFQADFTKQSTGGFTSTNKYYWPSDITSNNITFTAIYGATQVDGTPGNIASMEIPAAVSSQQDILVARHTSSAVQQPVPLNFYHALSQIYVRVKNTNPNIKVTITGVRVGYIATTGAFNYDRTSTGGVTDSDGKIEQSKWSNTAAVKSNKYDQDVTKNISGSLAVDADPETDGDDNALTSFSPWLLLPQNMVTDANSYGYNTGSTSVTEETKDNPDLATSYIAIKMKVQNISATSTDDEIIAAEQYHYWPITTNWNPGYKYIYMIDVANGGYYPSDRVGNDKALDPIMSPIVFSADCTVTDWDTASGIDVPAAS